MTKIAIIGAGEIGKMLAKTLAINNFNVFLYNRQSKNNKQTASIVDSFNTENNTNIRFTSELNDIQNSKVINFIAGRIRTPEQSRRDLLHSNIEIIKNFINQELLLSNPDATIVNAVNPLDHITTAINRIVRQYSKSNLVIGMGSSLDTVRFKDAISITYQKKYKNTCPNITNAFVVGEHGENMIFLDHETTIGNQNIRQVFSEQEREQIYCATRNKGKQIIIETGHSDVVGPNNELFKINSVLADNKISLTIPLSKEVTKSKGICIGSLCNIIDGDTIKDITISLSDKQKKVWNDSIEAIEADLKDINLGL